jgi:hypothetical protein
MGVQSFNQVGESVPGVTVSQSGSEAATPGLAFTEGHGERSSGFERIRGSVL